MFWSLFTTDDRFDLPFQHVTMSGSISRNLSFGPWWPLDALGISKNSCMAAEAIPIWKKKLAGGINCAAKNETNWWSKNTSKPVFRRLEQTYIWHVLTPPTEKTFQHLQVWPGPSRPSIVASLNVLRPLPLWQHLGRRQGQLTSGTKSRFRELCSLRIYNIWYNVGPPSYKLVYKPR